MFPVKAEQFNLTRDKYLTMPNLQRNRKFIIKPADKGSAVVVWDKNNYWKEVEKQLSDKSTYLEIKIIEKYLISLVEESKKMFQNF